MNDKTRTARLGAALLLGAAILTTAGCGQKSGAEVEAIQEAGVLKVAIVDTNSCYTSLQDGNPVGIEPELTAYIAEALGVTPQYQVCDRAAALSAVKSGEADIAIGGINSASGKAEQCLSSVSYGKGFFYAVTKRDDFALTVGALENSSVGVVPSLDEATRNGLYGASGVSVSDVASVDEAAERLKNGQIRAYICYEDQAKQLLEDEELQIQNLTNLQPEEFAIMAEATDQTLMSGINVLIPQFLEAE